MPITKTELEEKVANLETEVTELRSSIDGTNQDMQNSVRKFRGELDQAISVARKGLEEIDKLRYDFQTSLNEATKTNRDASVTRYGQNV